jgi:CRISPR-associated protein Csm4
MVNFALYRLCPEAPMHIGERGIGMEEASVVIHSDSLFGALSCAWSTLHGDDELTALLGGFLKGEPPFLISSAFPFISNMLLFPKPLNALAEVVAGKGPGPAEEKKIKRAEFVSKDVFEWILRGKRPEGSACEFIYNGNKITAIASSSEVARMGKMPSNSVFWRREEAAHVVLDRDNQSSSIFRVGDVSFSEGTGLYFLADFRDRSIISKFDAAMRLLGEEGIGGERSSGKGSFRFKRETAQIGAEDGSNSINDSNGSNGSNDRDRSNISNSGSDDNNAASSGGGSQVLLSLYHPEKTEVELGLLNRSRYQLITRRGWISSQGSRTLRKKTVRMISEGSIIPKIGSLPRGALVDVTPQEMKAHRVYANGLAMGAIMKERP